MEIIRKKATAATFVFPLITAGSSTYYTTSAWSNLTSATKTVYTWAAGSGNAPTSATIAGNPTQLESTGVWWLSATANELNYDYVEIKLAAAEIQEQTLIIKTVNYDFTDIPAAILGASTAPYTVSGTVGYDIGLLPNINVNVGTAIAGVPTNFTAVSAVLNNVQTTTVTGAVSSTWNADGVYWQTTNTAGTALDCQLYYNLGTTRVSQVTIFGRFVGAGSRYVNVYAWNYITSAYDQISNSTTRINHSLTDQSYTYNLLPVHRNVETSANGQVRIRFLGGQTNADNLYLDQVLVKGVAAGATPTDIAQATYDKMVYTIYNGGVWIDTIAGFTGTELGVNGLDTHPCSTLSDATIITSALGVKRLYFKPDSSVVFTQNKDYWRFIGRGVIGLGGQSINDAVFENCELVSGTSTGQDAIFDDCCIGGITIDSSEFHNSSFKGTFVTVANGVYTFKRCIDDSGLAATPVFDMKTSATLAFRDWRGGIQFNNMSASNTVKLDGIGRVIFDSTCSGGDVTIRGFWTIVDNASSRVTVTQTAMFNTSQPVGSVTNPITLSAITDGTITSADFAGSYWDKHTGVINDIFAFTGSDTAFTVSAYQNFPSVNVSSVTDGTITSADFATDYWNKQSSLEPTTVGVSAFSNFPQVYVSANGDKTGYSISANTDKTGYSVSTVLDKTNYTVSAGTITTVTGNVNGSVNSITNPVTVGTNNDKTNYTISAGTVDTVTNPVTVNTYQNFPQVNVSAIQSGAVDSIQANLASATQVTNVQTTVNAVSAQTNKFTFDGSNNVNAYSTNEITIGQVTVSAINAGVITSATMNANVFNKQTDSILAATTAEYTTSGTVGYDIGLLPNINSNVGTVIEGVPQNYLATSASTISVGTQTTGTYADTYTVNGVYWEITPVSPAVSGYGLDVRAYFNIGTTRVSQVTIVGRWQGTGNSTDIWAYNYLTSAYELIANNTTRMNHSTTDQVYTYNLLTQNQSETGNVSIRFTETGTTVTQHLWLDQILVKASIAGSTPEDIANAVYNKMIYSVYDGAVWIDTNNGTAGTVIGENGIPTSPVSNLTDAISIATILGVKKFYVYPESTLQLTQTLSAWFFDGKEYTIDVNGQNCSNTLFNNAHIIGTVISTTSETDFSNCSLSAVSLTHSDIHSCDLKDTVTFLSANSYYFDQCFVSNPDDSPLSAYFNAAADVHFRHHSGSVIIYNFTSASKLVVEGYGEITIDSSCSGGIVSLRGNIELTDNSGGSVTVDDGSRYQITQPVGSVTSPTNVSAFNGNTTSVANLVKSSVVMVAGTIDNTSFAPTTTAFESDDVTDAQSNIYKDRIIIFTSGSLLRCACSITAYSLVGGRGHFTVTALPIAASNDDTFIIV